MISFGCSRSAMLLQLVVVDGLGFAGHAVGDDLVGLAGKIQRMAVREVSAVRQVQAENRVARLDDRGVGGHVRGRAGMRLHVGVLGAEELLGAIARQVLDHIGELASAVVALAGITLGVLVGEDRARGFQHRLAHEILRGDQLQAFVLAALFVFDGLRDLGINFRQREFHRIGVHDCVLVLVTGIVARGDLHGAHCSAIVKERREVFPDSVLT